MNINFNINSVFLAFFFEIGFGTFFIFIAELSKVKENGKYTVYGIIFITRVITHFRTLKIIELQ